MSCYYTPILLVCLTFTFSDIRGQYIQIQKECPDVDTCFTLYRAEAGITWTQALAQCRAESGRLAIIPNAATQDVIGRFTGSVSGFDQYSWIGGQRSPDARWRNVRGAVIPEQDSIYEGPGGNDWCSFVEVGVFAGVESVSCFIQEPYAALCEFPTSSNRDSRCANTQDTPAFEVSGVCHVISDVRFKSRTNALDYCWATYNGPLGSLYEIPESYWTQYHQNGSRFWAGFYRRPWLWIESQYVSRQVTYSNWRAYEGEEGVDCMIIDMAKNSGWRDRRCAVPVQHFLCEGDNSGTGNENNQTTVITTVDRDVLVYQVVVGVLVFIVVVVVMILVIGWIKLRHRRKPAKLDFPSDMRFHNTQPEAATSHVTTSHATTSHVTSAPNPQPEPEDVNTVPKSAATSLPTSPISEAEYDTIVVATPKSYFGIPGSSSGDDASRDDNSVAVPIENYTSLGGEHRTRNVSSTEYECLPGDHTSDPQSPDYLQPI